MNNNNVHQTGDMGRLPVSTRRAILEGLTFTCRVFWGPDLEFCTGLHQGDGLDFLDLLERQGVLDSSPGLHDSIRSTVSAYQDAEALFQNLEQRYVALFVSNREGIAAPLYHSCYSGPKSPTRGAMLMGPPALAMKKRLEAVGLELAADLNQMPDHLCIEIEYLYFLLQEGLSGNDGERMAQADAFVTNEMLPWVREFQHLLNTSVENDFYLMVASLLVALLNVIPAVK